MTHRRSESGPIAELRQRLSMILAKHGFAPSGLTQFVDGRGFDRWSRANRWKREIFEIDYPRRQPEEVSAKVFVKILTENGREVTVDGASLAFLSGRPAEYHLQDLSLAEYLRMIETDAERGVEWLELYASPGRALERMRTATRNGCGKGTDPYEDAVAFLSKLQSH